MDRRPFLGEIVEHIHVPDATYEVIGYMANEPGMVRVRWVSGRPCTVRKGGTPWHAAVINLKCLTPGLIYPEGI